MIFGIMGYIARAFLWVRIRAIWLNLFYILLNNIRVNWFFQLRGVFVLFYPNCEAISSISFVTFLSLNPNSNLISSFLFALELIFLYLTKLKLRDEQENLIGYPISTCDKFKRNDIFMGFNEFILVYFSKLFLTKILYLCPNDMVVLKQSEAPDGEFMLESTPLQTSTILDVN